MDTLPTLTIDIVRNNIQSPKVDLHKNKIHIHEDYLQGKSFNYDININNIDYDVLFQTHINNNTNNNNIKKHGSISNMKTISTMSNISNMKNISNMSTISNMSNINKQQYKTNQYPQNPKHTIVTSKDITELQQFINELCGDTESYTLKSSFENTSFIESLCLLLDKNSYIISNRESKLNTLIELKKKLAYDLDEKNLYKLYNLKEVSRFKKSDVQKNILDGYDTIIDFSITSYISHILNCNIIIVYHSIKKYVYGNIYNSDRDTCVYIIYEGIFYILLHNETNNRYSHSFIKRRLIDNDAFKNIDAELLKFYIPGLKYDNLNIKKSAKLADIQVISQNFNIPLLKSSGKNKSVKELLDEIQSLCTFE